MTNIDLMKKRKHKKIFTKCRARGLAIEEACEVGVYMPRTSNVIDFIDAGVRTTLVEPDSRSIAEIRNYFSGKSNIVLITKAIYDYDGRLELVQRDASTFASALAVSPAIVNDRYVPNDSDKFTVECCRFNEIDKGNFDLVSADTEGCEWYVVKNLISRPKVISIETHGKSYLNPFMKEISEWMSSHDYRTWYKDNTDTVYVRRDLFDETLIDRVSLMLRNVRIAAKKYKHELKKRLVSSSRSHSPVSRGDGQGS